MIDSTGLKVFCEGEWKVRQHGAGKRRVWRKVHVGLDAQSGEVQTDIARTLRSRCVDYVLCVKDNHPKLVAPSCLPKPAWGAN